MKFVFENYKRILITGGSGFIGKNLIRNLLTKTDHEVFNIDKNSLENEIFKVKNIPKQLGNRI